LKRATGSQTTPYHANLARLDERQYVADIERARAVVDRQSTYSPVKCFRYAMDNWGSTQRKFDAVAKHLDANDFTAVPINLYDTEFIGPITSQCPLGATWR
jgi:hypothetical protein